jgi:hypothetical protein
MKTRACEVCKRLIDPERIDALPETRLCTEHARMIAKYGGEFILTTRQERLNKENSLKRNYGGVSAKMRRNHLALKKLCKEYDEAQRHGGE